MLQLRRRVAPGIQCLEARDTDKNPRVHRTAPTIRISWLIVIVLRLMNPPVSLGFPGGSMGKESAYNAGDPGDADLGLGLGKLYLYSDS